MFGWQGWLGGISVGAIMSLTGISKLNRKLKPIRDLNGFEFAEASLRQLGVVSIVGDDDLAKIPDTGPFIVCSNHPYGGIDGMFLFAAIGKKRPDVRSLSTYLVTLIPNMRDLFIPVDPFSKGTSMSISGLKKAITHVKNGGGLIIFPAGEVSSNRNPEHIVKDIEWEASIMKLIKKLSVPVIPAYFSGENSNFFHFLGTIHPSLRTIRIPAEMLNKKKKEVYLKFGTPVKPAELPSYDTPEELASYLKNRTYAMEGILYGSQNPVPAIELSGIDAHLDPQLLKNERKSISSSILFSEGGYTCYVNCYDDIPLIIKEIGICREETFRKNGEGTGKSIDLDEYDKYYLHMHIWKDDTDELVGAYRLGLGNEIMRDKGIHGFYSDLFFHFKDSFAPYLEKSIELGRSFVVEKYQTVPNALKMLLTHGIGRLSKRFPEMKYFIGPASISSNIPPLFGSLIVEYLKRTRFDSTLCHEVQSDIPFTPTFHNVDIESMKLESLSIDQFDKALSRMSNGLCRVPPLIRAYYKQHGRFLGFNVDPDFNYCIDAFVLVEIADIDA